MGAAVFKLRRERLVLSENDVERQVCDYLKWQGWLPMRNHVGAFVPYAKAMQAIERGQLSRRDVVQINSEGTADWLFIHGNYPALWVEVKAPGKKPTAAQLRFLDERRIMQQLATWTDNLEAFKAWYIANVIPKATA